MRWASLLVAVVALSGCDSGGDREAVKPVELDYALVPLTDEQTSALSRLAFSERSDGRVPSDVAMVVNPQPAGIEKGKVLIAVSYASCGHSLGRATLAADTVVVEKRPPDEGGTGCGGRDELVGMLVTVPGEATVAKARVETA